MKVTLEIPDSVLRDLLASAFEGGSNYWCEIKNYLFPAGITIHDFRGVDTENPGRYTSPDGAYYHPSQLIPFVPGCVVVIGITDDSDGKTFFLELSSLERGVQAMCDKYPERFAEVLNGSHDAETADVFLQCCLFCEVVYG